MNHLVERVVEGRDGRDDAHERLAHGVHAPLFAVVREVAGETLAVIDERMLRGKEQHIAGTAHFVHRVFDAKACL